MMTPPDHCDPLDSVNAMLKSNIRQQRLLTQSLRQPGLKKKAHHINPLTMVTELFFSSDRKKLSDLKKDADKRFKSSGMESPKMSNMPEPKESDDGERHAVRTYPVAFKHRLTVAVLIPAPVPVPTPDLYLCALFHL